MSEVRERPIPFSSPMVRAILAGTKTQTRRVACKGTIPAQYVSAVQYEPGRWRLFDAENAPASRAQYTMPPCRYGQPGDRLWVREAWRTTSAWDLTPPRDLPGRVDLHYEADGRPNAHFCFGKLRPGMFMPRGASRITLEVTGVRVERLQTINRGDAMAEGCPFPNMAAGDDPRRWFAGLWQDINGLNSWRANPWVWVVEFKRLGAT